MIVDPPAGAGTPPGAPLGARIHWREIAALLLVALLVRAYKGLVTPVIAEDGVVYIEQAAQFRAGEIREALRGHYPPLYPASIASAQIALPDPVAAGKAVSALFGALAIIPLVILGQAIFPPAAVRAAALVYILAPYILTFAGDVLSESVYLFLVLCALAALWKAGATGGRIPAASAGICAGLASISRPEGILIIPFGLVALLILPGRDAPRRQAMASAAIFLGVFLAPVIPYTVLLRAETGEWQFTRKGGELLGGLPRYAVMKKVSLEGYRGLGGEEGIALREAVSVIARNPGLFIEKYVHDFSLLAVKSFPQAIHYVPFVLFLAGVLFRRPSGRGEWCLIAFLVWYIACIAVNYPNPRFLVGMAAPAILWSGVGMVEMGERLRRRFSARPLRVEIILAGVVAVALGARAFQPERTDKAWLKEAGETIRLGGHKPTVCSRWRRLAFYSGADHIPFPDVRDYGALMRLCRESAASHLAVPRRPTSDWFFDAVSPEDLDLIVDVEGAAVYMLRPAPGGAGKRP